MAKNIIINGVTYNGVESLSLQTAEGEAVEYTEALPDAEGVTFGG